METKTIHQTVLLRNPARAVFDAWLDTKQHAAFTGMTADISREVGAKFHIGHEQANITGRNLELCLDRRLVQSWRIDIEGWPADHESRLTLTLTEDDGKTRVEMCHENVPAICATPIAEGWHRFYWQPLQRFLEAQS